MYGRNVRDAAGNRAMRLLRKRHVFHRCRSNPELDMRGMSGNVKLSNGRPRIDRLRLQRRGDGPQRRRVLAVCRRKVQDGDRTRDVR